MKNEAIAEVASGIGFGQIVFLFLVGFAKIADPTKYSLLAQTPVWVVVVMLIMSVLCLLADWYFRPRPKKAIREQDSQKIKNKNWQRNHYFSC